MIFKLLELIVGHLATEMAIKGGLTALDFHSRGQYSLKNCYTFPVLLMGFVRDITTLHDVCLHLLALGSDGHIAFLTLRYAVFRLLSVFDQVRTVVDKELPFN